MKTNQLRQQQKEKGQNATSHNIITHKQCHAQCHARCIWINPVVETPWSGGATRHPKTLVLKFAIVKELEQFFIFFHFVPDVQPHGNYTKMFMYNVVRNNEPSFCKNLNVSHTWHSIYENNEAACNSTGYSFHAFKITTSTKPTRQILVMLGNALCETLNGIRQNISIQCMLKKTTCFGRLSLTVYGRTLLVITKPRNVSWRNLVTRPIKQMYMIRTKI